MRVARLLTLLALLAPLPARAQAPDLLGRQITAVRIEVEGRPADNISLVPIVETRAGDALTMARVRETIDHLVGLGRYADVRVYAEPDGAGVALRWTLTPLRFFTGFDFHGDVALDTGELRTAINERFGSRVQADRTPEIVAWLRDTYRDRGYPFASIEIASRSSSSGETRGDVTVRAGSRTTIAGATVVGTPPRAAQEVLAQLDLEAGRPYDRVLIERRVAEYEEELRGTGYYEASAEVSARFADDGRTAEVTLDVRPGRRVQVVFTGDALDESRREELVPIRRERSVDQDLLEDASRNIENHLRAQGYRSATAPYTAETRSGELIVTFAVTRGPLHRIGAVHVDGVSALSREQIDPLLRLEPGEPYVESRVATIASAITELYRVQGFTRATVAARPEVLPESTRGADVFRPVDVRFTIGEGPRALVGDVAIDGASAIPGDRIQGVLRLAAGRPFYRPQLTADRDAIEALYRDEGFQRAAVTGTPRVSEDGTAVEIQWTIVEGTRTLVDHVLVTGNERTSTELILREVTLKPGSPLGDRAVVDSQQRLGALGLFRRVRITELPHGATGSRDIVIEVEEAPATTISYGGGLEAGRQLRTATDGGAAEERVYLAPRGFFEVGRRNLWGKNRSINLFTRVSFRPRDPAADNPDPTDTGGYGFNEYRVVGLFREPRAFGTAGDAQATAFIEQAGRSSFDFKRRGLQAEYGRRYQPALTLSGRYAFSRTQLSNVRLAAEDQLLIDRLFPQVRLSVFTSSLLRDSRDDVLDPTRGTVVGIDGSIAARRLGSEVGFAKTFFQGSVYRRIGGRGVVFASSARLGFAIAFEREVIREDENGNPVAGPDGQPIVDVVDEVPASERFYAGGDTTVRGFALDRLGTDGTLNAAGFPTGGNGLVVLNAEVRAPYWKGLGLVGFLDAGNVFRRAGDVSLSELRGAAGAGIRYRSPIGPLRVDVGFKLDRRTLRDGSRERGYVLHISLGQAF